MIYFNYLIGHKQLQMPRYMPTYKKDAFKDMRTNIYVNSILDREHMKDYIKKWYEHKDTNIYYDNTDKDLNHNNNVYNYLNFVIFSGRAECTRPLHTIINLFTENILGIQDELIRMFKEVRDEPYKQLAIQKIKRNAIYNKGLGLKLAVREYEKEF